MIHEVGGEGRPTLIDLQARNMMMFVHALNNDQKTISILDNLPNWISHVMWRWLKSHHGVPDSFMICWLKMNNWFLTVLLIQSFSRALIPLEGPGFKKLPKLKFDQHFCDACKIGKQAHASHKAKNVVSMTRCLELLHMDLFGPSAVRSYEGNRYTLVIVDDYSRGDEISNKPKNVNEALGDESWIVAMQEELNQFVANGVLELVPQPRNMKIIGTKWVFRNKLDENGIVSQNKARLVAQGYNQQEGINYDETYAPVARLESIRILLSYACALDFKLFQMDVKSAFLNGFINEKVYVAQPPVFIDFKKPDHVYKLKKALYGLKQAPKAWYDRLKAFLIKHEYKMGMVDNTLFTKKKSSNLIIVQIYADDIIFEMLKKFGLEDSKPMKTPMSSDTKLTKDEEYESVDSTKYRGMIGSLLYLTASRPDIMFSVCLFVRFQKAPKTSHLEAVKRIF
ncbi:retrovirus-related pol polyprotein from transposon TNT 1-94 [Tanacetum coccineum]